MNHTKLLDRFSESLRGESPTYLIAEVGTTCNGDMDKAKLLIEAAAAAGADAIKFQLIDPTQVTDRELTYPVTIDGVVSQFNMREMFERLQFSEAGWIEIRETCQKCGINFFATVDFIQGVKLLEEIGVFVHKIGAWDITYRPLIEAIGRTGKPMFVDLGPATQGEVDEAIAWYLKAGGDRVLLMHDFHTLNEDQMNMRAIQHLKAHYSWPVGFSSPGRDNDLDILALAQDSTFIEKRLILSRSEAAFHSHESLEPDEFGDWVSCMRRLERALGHPRISPSDEDRCGRAVYYRSVCTLRRIRKGEVFSTENLGGRRPGGGIPTKRLDEIYGRVATRELSEDHLVCEGDFL